MTSDEQAKLERALDGLALALADCNHLWDDDLRDRYETAISIMMSYGGCKEIDSSASVTRPFLRLVTGSSSQFDQA